MIDLANLETWFVAGIQHLYGPETLNNVHEHSTAIASALSASTQIPVKVVVKPVMTSGELPIVPRCKRLEELRWADHMDAYVFSGTNVDCWSKSVA